MASFLSALADSPVVAYIYWAYIHQAKFLLFYCFDVVFSFSLAFALVYGLASFAEGLLPPRPGARPRFWLVPLVFIVVALLFPVFLDRFVASIMQVVLGIVAPFENPWFMEVIASVWAAGVIRNLFRMVRGWLWLSRQVCAMPEERDNPALRAALAAAGMGTNVHLKKGTPGTPVFSHGLWRSVIVVPDDFESRYRDGEQYAILLHECTHIRNGDIGLLLWLAVARAILWFDPVSRHAARRVRNEMELLCDWMAIHRYHLEAESYAGLVVAEASGHGAPVPAFSGSYHLLTRRLGVVLRDPDLHQTRLTRYRAGVLTLAMAGLFVAAAAVYQTQRPYLPDTAAVMQGNDGATYTIPRYGVFATFAFTVVGLEK